MGGQAPYYGRELDRRNWCLSYFWRNCDVMVIVGFAFHVF